MALALVRSLDVDSGSVVLHVDTGTNPLYQVRLGRQLRRDEHSVVLDDVYWASPWQRNPRAGQHLDTGTRYALPDGVVEPRSLLQVVSGKEGDRGTAYSSPRRVPRPVSGSGDPLSPLSGPGGGTAMSLSTRGVAELAPARLVGVRSARECFSRPASVSDLLGSLVQAAGPILQQLLTPGAGGSPATPAGAGAAPGAAAPGAPAPGNDQLAALLTAAIKMLLGSLGGSGLAAPASVQTPNRLTAVYARPFIFGIDDAVIAALAGPIISSVAGPLLQALPELLNAANQHRLDSRREDYQMIESLLGGLDRTKLIERLTAAGAAATGPAPAPAPGGADLGQLLALLRTAQAPSGSPNAQPSAPAASPAPPAAAGLGAIGAGAAGTAPVAAPLSGLTRPRRLVRPMSASRAVLVPVVGPTVPWMGSARVVFAPDRTLGLRFRLDVGPGGPASPLPRAILTVTVREDGGRDLLTKEERLQHVVPGSEVRIPLRPDELAAVPVDTEVELFARLRWPAAGETRQATCAQRVVLGRGHHVAGAGVPAGEPVELTDMTRFRPFWNKLWSSPPLTDDVPLWGVDLTVRYSVVLTAEAAGNGVMEVRTKADGPARGLRATTSGRMRSGLEVSIHELNKLAALWPEGRPLDETTLAAFAAPAWRATQGGDAEVAVAFDGRRHSRGMLWAVPVPSLRRFPVARISEVDPHGQVVATTSEEVTFPVIEAVRLLGLSSTTADADTDAGDAGTGTGYAFEGYRVVRDTLVGLEPAALLPAPAPAPPAPVPAPAAYASPVLVGSAP